MNGLMRYGRSLTNPENIWYSYHTFMYKFYCQTSITHNMVTVDLKQQEAMTPEVEALVAKAKEEAKRAGEARKAQASLDNRPSGKAPGTGRRGVVRL